LDRVRKTEVTDGDLLVLYATSEGVAAAEWDDRKQLRSLNMQVKAFNEDKLSRLSGAEFVYKFRDEINRRLSHPARRAFAERAMQEVAPAAVVIKPGAIVLSTREVDGVATASQGVVKKCLGSSVVCDFFCRLVVVEVAAFDVIDNCGSRLATRHSTPLVLAWSMTIHRAQAASLSTLSIDICELNWRLEGLVNSSLSRYLSLDGLLVRVLRHEHIVVDSDAMQFYAN